MPSLTSHLIAIVLLIGSQTALQFTAAAQSSTPSLVLDPDPQVAYAQTFRDSAGFRSDAAYVKEMRLRHPMYPGAAPQPWAIYLTPAESASLDFRQRLSESTYAAAFQSYLTANNSEYGGLYIDQKGGGRAEVLMTGHQATHQAALRSLSAYPGQIDVIAATYTESALAAGQSRLEADRSQMSANGVTLTGTSIDVVTGTVEVDVAKLNQTVRDYFAKYYGDLPFIALKQSDGLRPSANTEQTLSPPFEGGQQINNSVSGNAPTCTFGWNVVAGSAYFAMTAGHCNSSNWGTGTTWYQGLSGQLIGTVDQNAMSAGADAMRIPYSNGVAFHGNKVLSSFDVNGIPYFNSITSQQAQGADRRGDYTCFFGKSTGYQKCGQIQSTTYSATIGPYTFNNLRTMDQTNLNYDSGAPMYHPSAALAMGTLSGVQSGTGFTAYTHIYESTIRLGVSVDTTSPRPSNPVTTPNVSFNVPGGSPASQNAGYGWLDSRLSPNPGYSWVTNLCPSGGGPCATPLSKMIQLTEGTYRVTTSIRSCSDPGVTCAAGDNFYWESGLAGIAGNQATPLSRSIYLGSGAYYAYSTLN